MSATDSLRNIPAPNAPYFTPGQFPPSGTAIVPQRDGKRVPTLFQPLKIRGLELQNRIVLSPLCQYSSKDGKPTDWHLAHLGGIISRGPGLSFVEATAVTAQGRISPEDLGLWSDEQIPAFAALTTFAHSQNQKIAIQLAHAGRKASTVAPWLALWQTAGSELGGWADDIVAPSAVQHNPELPIPKELTKEDIKDVVAAFAEAAKRAVRAGFDVIEIHGAHGFLLHSFMSPASNFRTDEYGGSFENRTRIIVEVVDAIRAVIPEDMPLFYRISATDRLETSMPDLPSWRIEDTVKLTGILADHGVDLIDVSSAGNHPRQSLTELRHAEAYHSDLSAQIKSAVGDKILVSAVGGIKDGKTAQAILDKQQADVIFIGRQFLRNPGTVWQFADDLGVQIKGANQIEWVFIGRGMGRALNMEKPN